MRIPGGSTDIVIRIRIQRLDPLTGTAAADDGAGVSFEGWMELIGAVAELLGFSDRSWDRARQRPRRGPRGGR